MATGPQFGATGAVGRQRPAATEASDDGGGFSLPKLGLGTLFRELGAIPGGLMRIGTSLAPGGEKSLLPQAARSFAGSVLGTAATTPAMMLLGEHNPYEGVGDFLLGQDASGQDYVRDSFERVSDRGILPTLVEDIGNVALVAAPASAALRVGSTAGRVAGASRASTLAKAAGFAEGQLDDAGRIASKAMQTGTRTRKALKEAGINDPLLRRAGKRAAQAERAVSRTGAPDPAAVSRRLGQINVAETLAHPYQGIFRDVLSPLARAGQARQLAAAAEAAPPGLLDEAADAAPPAGLLDEAAGAAPPGLEAAPAAGLLDDAAGLPGAKPPRVGPAQAAAERLANQPVPRWAQRQVSRLGDKSVERLAKVEGRLQRRRVARVTREQERFAESSRRQLLRSGAVQSSVRAVAMVERALAENPALVPAGLRGQPLSRVAETLVYDDLEKGLAGTAILDEAVRRGAPPELQEMISKAFGGRSRMPQQLRNRVAGDLALADAEWRTLASEREAIMFGSPIQGTRGVEDARSTSSRLTPAQAKELRRIEAEFRRISGSTTRVEKERLAAAAELQRKHDEVASLMEQSRREQMSASGHRAKVANLARPVWLQDANRGRAFEELAAATLANGGATMDPHAGRMVIPRAFGGSDVGFSVGFSGRQVALAEFQAQAVRILDEFAADFEPALMHPDAKLGTWVDGNGIVHIDVSQTTITRNKKQVPLTRSEAIVLGTGRGERAIFDLATGNDISLARDATSVLVAAHHAKELARPNSQFRRFLLRSEAVDRRLDTFAEDQAVWDNDLVSGTARATGTEDFDRMRDLLMRIALGATTRGRFGSLDEAWGAIDVEARKSATQTPEGALLQLYLSPSFLPSEATSKAMWNDIVETLGPRANRALRWYNEAHDTVEARWRNETVQLFDEATGAYKDVNAADLMYSLLALTSVNAAPADNMASALAGVSALLDFQTSADWVPKFSEALASYQAARKEALAAGKKPSSGVTKELLFEEIAKRVPNVGDVKDNVMAVLSGKLLDEWDNAFVAERFGRKGLDAESLAKKNKLDPATLDEAAIRDLGGSTAYAKIRNFWENLRDPQNSQGVTLDRVMSQMLGLAGGNWNSPGAYKRAADALRHMAAEVSVALGREVLPHQVQALMWVYTKDQVNKKSLGRVYGAATDALESLGRRDRRVVARLFREGEDAVSQLMVTEALLAVAPKPKGSPAITRIPVRVADSLGGPRRTETQFHQAQKGSVSKLGFETKVKVTTSKKTGVETTKVSGWEHERNLVADLLEAGDVEGAQAIVTAWARGQQKRYTNAAQYLEDFFTKKHGDKSKGRALLDRATTQQLPSGRPLADPSVRVPGAAVPGDLVIPKGQVLNQSAPPALYHGTDRVFDTFGRPEDTGTGDSYLNTLIGNFLTDDPAVAQTYADRRSGGAGGRVVRARVREEGGGIFKKYYGGEAELDEAIRRHAADAAITDPAEAALSFRNMLQEDGWSGVTFDSDLARTYAVFDPENLEVFQKLQGDVKGMFFRSSKTGRLTMRFFETADPTTLVHESGHLLRMLLAPEEVSELQRIYGSRVGDVDFEERFADDLLRHMNTGQAPAGLEGTYGRIREALAEWWEAFTGRFMDQVDPGVAEILDRYLDPEAPGLAKSELPGMSLDLSGKTARQIASLLPRRPGETQAQSLRRGYKAGRDVERADAFERQAAQKVLRARRIEAAASKLEAQMNAGQLPLATQATRATERATRRLAAHSAKAAVPRIENVPGPWKPLWGAMLGLMDEAKGNQVLADAISTLPQTFPELVRYIQERGGDPVHVSSLTDTQVQALMFEPVRLMAEGRGLGRAVSAGFRKSRRSAFARERTLAALAAGHQDVVVEANTNALVQHIDTAVARPVAAGGVIPPGWAAWDPIRTNLLTQKAPDGSGAKLVTSPAVTKMVPEAVVKGLRSYGQDFRHGMVGSISKVTNPWRALVLTWTPRWYVNNLLGNMVLTMAAGVSWKDWQVAVAAWRKGFEKSVADGDIDAGVLGAIGGGVEGIGGSLLPTRRPVAAFREARSEGAGFGEALGAGHESAAQRVSRVNHAVDDLGRAAVYVAELRKHGDAERALMRSYEALIDYGNLSPFERQVVRQFLPFYAWQKNILKLVAKMPMDHPVAAALVMQLGVLNEELGQELPEMYRSLVAVPGLGYVNTRGINPFQDAGSLTTPQGVARSVNPFIGALVRNAFGAPASGFPEHQRINEFGQVVPDTSPAEDLAGTVLGVPQSRLVGVEGYGGYEGQPPLPRRLGSFFGAPTYSDEDVARFKERIAKSKTRLSGGQDTQQQRRTSTIGRAPAGQRP